MFVFDLFCNLGVLIYLTLKYDYLLDLTHQVHYSQEIYSLPSAPI